MSQGIGIDISDHHLRIAVMNRNGTPAGLYELVLSSGYVEDDRVVKPEGLNKQVRKLLAKTGLTEITAPTNLLMSESRVFSASFVINGKRTREDRMGMALEYGQQEIPIPFKEAQVVTQEGVKTNRGFRETIFASQTDVLAAFRKALLLPQFPVQIIEANNTALHRLFTEYAPKEALPRTDDTFTMFVDMGHRWTNITVFDRSGAQVFSRSVAIRKASEKSMGKMKPFKKVQVDNLLTHIQESVTFFTDQEYRLPLILFCGVEAQQKGLVEYCQKHAKQLTMYRIGDVVQVPNIRPTDVHVYGAAIGAGVRAARQGAFRKQHNFLIDSL